MHKIAVLLVNVGTPNAATRSAVRCYLSQFLRDKRIVDINRWLWYPLLHGVILPHRVSRVTKLYQSIWSDEGAPLLVSSRRQQRALAAQLPTNITVELAMTYGSPSINNALRRVMDAKVSRLIILPLYPQYSASTTSAAWDALAKALLTYRNLPEIRFIRDYAEHPQYILALSQSIKRSFSKQGVPDLLIFSYHGLPQRYIDEGDPYQQRCEATTSAVAEQLGLKPEQYLLSYQSRFGKDCWLKPYTDEMVTKLPAQGIKHLQIICPGFASDCLETLEEIMKDNQSQFINAGGEQYHYIPALNSDPTHIELFKQLVIEHQ